MFTTGSKWFLGTGLVTYVLAIAYAWTTGGNGLGGMTAGYNGGVGDHLGYTLLLTIALGSTFLGLVALATRDADTTALAQLVGAEVAPADAPPAHRAYWPVAGAFGAAALVLGLVISNVLFVAALILLGAVLVEWMVLAWSDRATGDPTANAAVRDRLMGAFEVPLAGGVVVIGAIVAFSRLMLTSSKDGAVIGAIVLGVVILAIGATIAARPKISANVVAGFLALCAVAVLGIGVGSAARGERHIEHHHEEEESENQSPLAPGTNAATTTTAGEEG